MLERFRKRSTQQIATELSAQLVAALGDSLLSLVEYHPERCIAAHATGQRNQLHVLIVLKEIDLESLTGCSEALRTVVGYKAIVPMVLSREELLASTDVFPITFLEMKHDYRVLAGYDLLAELTIGDAHLRLRCEQELKNLLLRMQSAFLLRCHRTRALLESLQTSYATFLRCLRAAVQVIGEAVPAENQRVVELAVSKLGLDSAVLERVEETCRVRQNVGASALAEVYGQLILEVHRAATAIDEYEVAELVKLDPMDE